MRKSLFFVFVLCLLAQKTLKCGDLEIIDWLDVCQNIARLCLFTQSKGTLALLMLLVLLLQTKTLSINQRWGDGGESWRCKSSAEDIKRFMGSLLIDLKHQRNCMMRIAFDQIGHVMVDWYLTAMN